MELPRIDKHVPLPKNNPKKNNHSAIIAAMEAGDSIWYAKHEEAHRLRMALINRLHNTSMRKDGEGWRVWRLKDDE